MSTPYAAAAATYRRLGWSPVPLPPRRKKPPPTGWTGYAAPHASGADVHEWTEAGTYRAGSAVLEVGNVGLRLPETVLGLDLDAYDGKPGLQTMLAAVARLGPLPPTWRSTSRDPAEPSGIRFYRVPPGRRWADTLSGEGSAVEVIHYGHRYAVAAPSVHPDTGAVYRWCAPDGTPADPPAVDDLPELPAAWVAELDAGDVAERSEKADLLDAEVSAWLDALPSGGPCRYVLRLLEEAADRLEAAASRHDTVRGYIGRMVRAGEQGHHGAGTGLDTLRSLWGASLARGKAREADAGEWDRMLTGAVALVVNDPTAPRNRGCCSAATKAPEHPAPAGEPEHPAEAGHHGGEKKSVATQLVELADTRWTFRMSTEGEAFALPLVGPQVVRMLTGSRGVRSELADLYQENTGKVAGQQALTDAVMVLEGRARRHEPVPLALRVAADDGAVWLDLGTLTGEAVKVTAAGWEVVANPPILFRRTALSGALPEPVNGGDLAELWALLNVAPESRPVLLAWLVAALLPDLPHPIAALVGEQGTGKSTASRMLAGLLDPSPAQLRKPPRDVEGWTTAAAGSWVVGVDNLSTIPAWWSDSLCRAVTGDGDVRRRLYSDADLTVFAFRRVVLLNGIDLGAVRDDLAERLLTVELHRITARRYDADLATAWEDAHPRILGALLDLAAQVLKVLPDVVLTDPPRMADFARILAAVDRVQGTAGLATYGRLAADLAADAVTGDPVLSGIVAAVTEAWTGTAAELLHLLGDPGEHRKEWPKDARAMTSILRRRAPALRRLGWTVDDLGRGGKAMTIRFHIAAPTGRRQAGDRAGKAGDDARQAGDNETRRLPRNPRVTCEDAENGPEAGDAGVISRNLLLDQIEREEDSTAWEIGRDSSPASPVCLPDDELPEADLLGRPAPRADEWPCPDCGRVTIPGHLKRCDDCSRRYVSRLTGRTHHA